MCEELNRMIKSIMENIPEVIIKCSKQGDPLKYHFVIVVGYFVKERNWNYTKNGNLLKCF